MNFPKFSGHTQSFHSELKRRINEYFAEAGKAQTGNFQLYFKAIVLVLAYLAVYTHLVFFTPDTWLALTECVVLGGLTAAIGFNIMHDGMHGSFSRYKWVNYVAGLSLNFLGANNFMWKTKHNIIHHTYTNIDGMDDDIEARPLLRLCDTQKYYKIHRFQHWYFWAAYSLLYIWWVFVTDYKKYFRKKIGDVPLKPMSTWDHISFWGFKILNIFIFVAVPITQVGFSAWLIGYLVFGLFAGFVLSIVFQLAHTVEDTHFPHADSHNRMEDEWAIHQLKTTANFATHNKVISWLVGGLNFQVEHHLFPKISHVHYPAISKIIKQACADFNVKYIEYPKMRVALASHVHHLKNLSHP
ncbi:MAG: acyl-CoA desaturase [Chitinophagales bacterium]|nr:acyl-CoA desaturase [Chitinophagales bacterium]